MPAAIAWKFGRPLNFRALIFFLTLNYTDSCSALLTPSVKSARHSRIALSPFGFDSLPSEPVHEMATILLHAGVLHLRLNRRADWTRCPHVSLCRRPVVHGQ